MANVLYLTTDGLTDPLGRSQILPYLMALAKLGHNISIISLEKRKRHHEFEPLHQTLIKNCIHWIPLPYHNKPPVLATIFDLYRMKKKAKFFCANGGIDIVHARSYLAGILGLSLKKSFQVKFLFDPRGFWIDERIEGRIWNPNNPIYRMAIAYLRKKEKKLFAKADALVILTEQTLLHLYKNKSLTPETPFISVIPCCADDLVFNPEKFSKDEIVIRKKKLGISPTEIVVCYHGSLGTWYMMEELINFFTVLYLKHPSAKMLLVTKDETDSYKNIWIKKGMAIDTLVIVQADHGEVPYLLALSDLCVFFYRPGFSKIATSPTKMAEIIFMRRPFITNSGVGDVNKLLGEIGKEKIVNEFSIKEYERVVNNLTIGYNNSIDYGDLFDYYSLRRGVQLYHALYEAID